MAHRIQQLFLFRTWAYGKAATLFESESLINLTVDRWTRFFIIDALDRSLLRQFKEWLNHSTEHA